MGAHQTDTFQTLLDKFLHVFVLCPTCGLPEVDLKCSGSAKSGTISGKCAACGWNGECDDANDHKMAKFVLKFEAESGGGKGKKGMTKEERRAAKLEKQRGGKASGSGTALGEDDDDDSD